MMCTRFAIEQALAEEATAAKAQADAEKAKVQEKIAADEAEKQKKRDAMTAAKSGSGAKSRMAAFNMMAEGEGGMSVEEQVRLEAAQRKEARAAKKRLAEEQVGPARSRNSVLLHCLSSVSEISLLVPTLDRRQHNASWKRTRLQPRRRQLRLRKKRPQQ